MLIDQVLFREPTTTVENEKEKVSNNETTKRSFAKTISWRVIGTLDTILISWAITGTFAFAISIGAIELFTKMILYFFHERIWNSINFGK
jgi:uncharacterized membrane protein